MARIAANVTELIAYSVGAVEPCGSRTSGYRSRQAEKPEPRVERQGPHRFAMIEDAKEGAKSLPANRAHRAHQQYGHRLAFVAAVKGYRSSSPCPNNESGAPRDAARLWRGKLCSPPAPTA